ncbi:MAG: DUF1343 domain-containing protein [Chloroflexi bacterium]|nr:DUF1343 domain-containing protein [Chloroflexota bacterium]
MVITGLEILLNEKLDLLKNQRVGLITNPTGVTRTLRSNVDVLRDAGVNLVALFGPEHGFAASAADGAAVESGHDARTGLPVYSLYGKIRKPTREMLAHVDVLLFDLQDVGVRFYTYTATLGLALNACAEHQVPLIVLDRPNPINGNIVEGAVLDPGLQSFIGHGPLPIRFGMTLGELAQFYNRELSINAELRVIGLRGWDRAMWFDETGLTWVTPSPGIPNFATTIPYPGMCFIEGTNLSEGRGTGLPFEIVGAPFLDGYVLADFLNAQKLDGVIFRPIAFTPCSSKHANVECYGVQLHITDCNAFRAIPAGLHVIAACRALAPTQFEFLPTSWEGRPPHFDLLTGDVRVREGLLTNQSIELLTRAWADDLARFDEKRKSYLLY